MPYKDKADDIAHKKRYYSNNKEKFLWAARLNNYGITKELFFDMLDEQDNKCALCEKPFQSIHKDCHVDHCHETNNIRGLLCMRCNVGLGMLGDNEEGLEKALNYVKGNS